MGGARAARLDRRDRNHRCDWAHWSNRRSGSDGCARSHRSNRSNGSHRCDRSYWSGHLLDDLDGRVAPIRNQFLQPYQAIGRGRLRQCERHVDRSNRVHDEQIRRRGRQPPRNGHHGDVHGTYRKQLHADQLVDELLDRWKRHDVLFHNRGFDHGGPIRRRVDGIVEQFAFGGERGARPDVPVSELCRDRSS